MASSFRTLDGRTVRFLRRRAFRHPAIRLGDESLVRCLPSRDCPAARSDPSPEPNGIPLGRDDSGRPVYLPVEPGQGRHLAILGETGMGKSSLLRAIAGRAARSWGVLLLDPLGETASAVRDDLFRTGRSFRWISPVDAPVTLNALAVSNVPSTRRETQVERRVQDLLHGLRRVRSGRYVDAPYWGPRLEEMLGRALRAAGRLPNGTLEDAHTLLATGGRLARPVPEEAAVSVRELAQRIRERPEDADGARRLLYEVVGSPILRSLLCDPSPSLSVAELVAPDRVVLVSGEARSIGESNARYLLSVYLALLWSELLGRGTDAKTFVLLDEVQWFGHESLAEMLRLARRANVHAVLGTQGLAALSEPIRDAVWTNVADFVAFRGAPDDARELARLTTGVRADHVNRLPRGAALVLSDKGHRVAWIRASRCPTEATRPAVSAPGRPGPDRPSPGPEDVLAVLRRFAEGQAPGALLSVHVRELRRVTDPAGAAVRAAGAALGRAGALVRTRATAQGPAWEVRVDRIPPAPRPPAPLDPREISEPPQPSLSRNGSFP